MTHHDARRRATTITLGVAIGLDALTGCGAGEVTATAPPTTYAPQAPPTTSTLGDDVDEGVITWAAEQTWITTGASDRAAMCFLWERDPARALRALDQPEFEEAFARILNREC